jgi:SWI/SNF-related matrix-associated actin-dependent regulator 1 of chromatin subfamily A
MYDELRQELALWARTLEGDEALADAHNVLTRLVRLAQLASNPALLDAGYSECPAKFLALDTLLRSHAEEARAKFIVWTSFVPNIPALVSRYPELKPVTIYGDMDAESRDAAVHAFKHDPGTRLMIANPPQRARGSRSRKLGLLSI